MQMQNNKTGLFILQTGAGGLSPLILTQYSSQLITGEGEEGNLNVAALNLFGIVFFFPPYFFILNILHFSVQIPGITFLFIICYTPNTEVKET